MTGGSPHQPAPKAHRLPVPLLLADLGGWAWRVLLLLAVGWVILHAVLRFELIAVPLAVALLVAAFLSPLTSGLRRLGLPRVLTTVAIVLPAFVVVGVVLAWIVQTAVNQYPALVSQLGTAVQRLPVPSNTLMDLRDKVVAEITSHQSELTQSALQGLLTGAKLLTGTLLALLFTLILLTDGDRMWLRLLRSFPTRARDTMDDAGRHAFGQLSAWIRGTVLIALFHATAVTVTLLLLGVPLVVPLALVVFIGSFVPLVGIFIGGGLAVLVTFAFSGPTGAAVMLGVLVVADQVEAHVLQPFLIGRYVRLHPFVVATVITAGAIVAGLPGTLFAVPLTAAIHAAFQRIELPEAPDAAMTPGHQRPRMPNLRRRRRTSTGQTPKA